VIAQYRSGENRSQSTGANRQPCPDLRGPLRDQATPEQHCFRSGTTPLRVHTTPKPAPFQKARTIAQLAGGAL
jgi:hypothetical protein